MRHGFDQGAADISGARQPGNQPGTAAVRTETMRGALSRIPAETADMNTRTTEATVRFSSTFLLPGHGEPQPPGEYRVEHHEEPIDGIARLAWRRVGTFIHLPAIASRATTRQMVPIDPADLDAALKKDQQQT